MKKLIAAALALGMVGVAHAQTVTVPQVQQINPTDLFQDIPLGQPGMGNIYAPAPLIATYSNTLPGGNSENALVGGDFTTNLFQRGTSVVLASPAAAAMSAADRWFVWGGTNTPITSSKQTGAADIIPNFGASLRINKASGAGVVQVCAAQEIETVNSIRFQNQTAEFDFHAKAGSTFSAAGSNLAVYILTGTGTDEGSANAAFSINAGGGSSTAWTGAAVLGGANGYLIPINTTWNRYTVVAPIPAGATEIAAAICYTPVGTGTSTDWFEIIGAQFVPNVSLTTVAGAAGVVLNPNDARAKSFLRRPQGLETALQQRYTYSISEAAAGVVQVGGGSAQGTTTTCTTFLPFPVTMRAAPTYTNALTASTFKVVSASQAATALGTPFSATLTANTVNGASINFTTTGMTAKDGCFIVGAGGTGLMLFTAEL